MPKIYLTYLSYLKKIKALASQIKREVKLMTLCGTHSQTIAQYNLKSILPTNIRLKAGPGCPICVTSVQDIDNLVKLSLAGIPLAIYGDAWQLAGSEMSLEKAKAQGADVAIIYSVEEALSLSRWKKNLVFFGVGFETTAPMTAWAVKKGLTVYSSHKLFPPAMGALLNSGELKIDGFINPGHVSSIIGLKTYQKFKIPQVVAGFKQEDVLIAIRMLLKQIIESRKEVENEYRRLVKPEGNPQALNLIKEVFEIQPAHWRGLGIIPASGLEIKKKFSQGDAKRKYQDILKKQDKSNFSKPSACQCSAVLRGLKEPQECPLFKKVCAPENPQGPCMVSIEGTCYIDCALTLL